MDVTVVNTPLPVKVESSEIKVKTTQIPFNLILNRMPGPTQVLTIKKKGTDHDLVINYIYASEIAAISGTGPANINLGIIITDDSLSTDDKNISILLAPNVSRDFAIMTSIVVTKQQSCSFFLSSTNAQAVLRADFFVSGFIFRQ